MLSSLSQNEIELLSGLRGNDNEKEAALQKFFDRLVFADQTLFDEYQITATCFSLASILQESVSTNVLNLALQCINSLLALHFAAGFLFLRIGILERINHLLKQTNSSDVASNCLHILTFFSQDSPSHVANSVDLRELFNHFPNFSKMDQRECITLISTLLQDLPIKSIALILPKIISILFDNDPVIRVKSLAIFSYIITKIPGVKVSEQAIAFISSQLDSNPPLETFSILIQILESFSKTTENLPGVSKYLPDVSSLLFTYDDEKCEACALQIIQALLPQPPLPKELWPNQSNLQLLSIDDISTTILPILDIYLSEKQRNIQLSLVLLATCSTLAENFSCDSQLINLFIHHSQNEELAPYILAITSTISSKQDVVRNGLLQKLTSVTFPPPLRSWSQKILAKLTKECTPYKRTVPSNIMKSDDLNQIMQYIEQEGLSSFEFIESTLINKVTSLFKVNPSIKASSYLQELGSNVLDSCEIPNCEIQSDSHSFPKLNVHLLLQNSKGNLGECQLPIHSDFLTVEGFYNLKFNSGIVERLKAAIADNYLLNMMVQIDEEDFEQSHMRFAIYCRAFQVDQYIKCSFQIGSAVFSAYDNLTYMMSKMSQAKFSLLPNVRFMVNVLHEDIPRSPLKIHTFADPLIQTAISYISAIKSTDFNDHFAKYVFSKLANPLYTLTLFSPSVRIMYQAPFLFTFEQRKLLFKMIGFDPVYGVRTIHDTFHNETTKKCKVQPSTINCTLSRDTTFQYGCFLLNRIARGRLNTEFMFKDGVGFGPGVTQEFFSIMSQEFCKRSTKMWRDNPLKAQQSDMIQFDENGYFPSIEADNGLLEILGILTSKAILMEKVVDIPFSPAFFSLLLTGTVDIEQVDPVLAKSLKCREGLYDLPFVYPGTNVELKKGGKSIFVDGLNVHEYIKLVKQFTCGDRMVKKLSHFRKTFETNIPLFSLSIFTPEEIVSVVCGEEVHFTMNDLIKYSKIEHGYNENSREIKDLFDVIVEMSPDEKKKFCKFLTGCSRLPNGGLSGLKPPLTIAKRASENPNDNPDDFLPSVMTCTNYFKLPPYSSKEKMRSKILIAINECQNTFQLS